VHHIINTLVAIGVLIKKGRAVQLNDKKFIKKLEFFGGSHKNNNK